jgi:ParB-like chromosome segregation protein Spo0J
MTIQSRPITDLHLDPANARRHSQRNLDAIMSSLARFGQQKPIVIDANHVVRAGNGTFAAAKALGWTHVDTVRTDLIGVEATAFAIADNRTAELAEWDPDVLGAALADPELGDLGFNDDEIRQWVDGLDVSPIDDPPMPTDFGESFQVVVDCESESKQKELFERLTAEGWPCRLLTL